MPWACTVTLDTDKADVGTATAVFTDVDATTFTHSARLRVSAQERDAFINLAISLRNAWRTRKTSEAGYKTNLDSRFVVLDV